jgi:hypothetical protein
MVTVKFRPKSVTELLKVFSLKNHGRDVYTKNGPFKVLEQLLQEKKFEKARKFFLEFYKDDIYIDFFDELEVKSVRVWVPINTVEEFDSLIEVLKDIEFEIEY